MKKINLVLSLIFLSIGLFGCQQNNAEISPDNPNVKHGELTPIKATDDNYDVIGIITEVNYEEKRVLLDLSKKIHDSEERLWVSIGENTTISNDNEELNFNDLKPEVELKVNLSGKCLDPNPRICFADEVIFE